MATDTQQTDRELLEMAAKAADYNFSWNEQYECGEIWPDGDKKKMFWQPHRDDGDAMRLRGRMGALIADEGSAVRVEIHRYPTSSIILETYGRDLPGGFASDNSVNSATRLALLRAAAKIGKAMP